MRKIFSASQIRAWDQYTIEHEPITSIELMERAARACVHWLGNQWPDTDTSFTIFCGSGNNGGDGLAIARLLLENAYRVKVYLLDAEYRSADNRANLKELQFLYKQCIHFYPDEVEVEYGSIVIDALFGTGLNRKAEGEEKELIEFINKCRNLKVSIDIPSGLSADELIPESEIVQADYTITFQNYKRTFLYPETGKYCGEIYVLDIQLDKTFEANEASTDFILTKNIIQYYYKKRLPFAHKGTYGHALMVAGSRGKMGACVLASKACLRSGAGLVSVLIPEDENAIIQTAVPEVMTERYSEVADLPAFEKYDAIGIGCGLGTDELAAGILERILDSYDKPLLLDADALNIISQKKNLLRLLPERSLLTPHPKEFERLFGESINSFERNQLQIEMSKQYNVYIILKGRFTSISTPDGDCYFNVNGNPGMATGGSGDVLSGIITGLFAQYRDMKIAALMGVYLHGLAGDIAAKKYSQESMIASDIIEMIGEAFKEVSND